LLLEKVRYLLSLNWGQIYGIRATKILPDCFLSSP
jgi:hypothetical protein